MNKKIFFLIIISLSKITLSQTKFPFLIYESMPFATSMKKNALNYTSVEMLAYNFVDTDSLSENKQLLISSSMYLMQLIMTPFSHEEGHRSVLTSHNIGSTSMQFFDKRGVATVSGITDAELIKFRNEFNASYRRLHTAGLESDYFIRNYANTLIAFEDAKIENILNTSIIRSVAIIGYQATSVFPKMFNEIEESANETENDIVGHDIFGAVKNFYRPADSFYRYTNYDDLSKVEKRYLKKSAFSSLLNVIMPSYVKFKIKNTKLSLGTGYTLAPFGGIYELSAWHKSKYKMAVSFQLFTNRNSNSLGVNYLWKDISLTKNLELTLRANVFQQPKDLLFDTKEKFAGFLAHGQLNYKISSITKKPFSFFMGLTYKTKGFVYGETYLTERAYFDFGTAIYLN